MSVRIHELARKIGMNNKELLNLLKDRGFNVKTVSSTIDNISAGAIVEELAVKPEETPPEPESASAPDDKPESAPSPMTPRAEPTTRFTTNIPSSVKVRSIEEITREKELQQQARAPVVYPPPRTVPPPPPRPAVRGAPAPRPPRPAAPSPAAGAAPSVPSRPAPPARPAGAPPPPPEVTGDMETAKPAETAGDIPVIQMKPPIVVKELAAALEMKPFKLISELMEMGIFASMNQSLEEPVAIQLAEKHGYILEVRHRGEGAAATPKAKVEKPVVDESALLEHRPPVVCILGHVDHGKTTLLDAIRQTSVVSGEAGGITQHIGAYQVERNGKKISFLDTPGHAAFTKMRARGADLTDIAILVVAADDGFMPQTDEALEHARRAKVSIVVAINKTDAKGANIDRVKTQMQERGIAPEDWGGETICVPVSAVKGEGIDTLLEMILLQAEVLELKANPKADPEGIVIESEMVVGRGPTATVIVQRGTLKVGDALVCGSHYCKVRSMYDDQGNQIKTAGPSTPVKVIGWSDTPDSGSIFRAVKNERTAKKLAEETEHEERKVSSNAAAAPKDTSVEALFANIAATKKKTLRVIVKCDVFGSVEAVVNVIEQIRSDKVSLEVIQGEVGLITKNDVLIASAAGASIIGFNTRLDNGVEAAAKHHGVRIETFEIIYELGDKVKEMMAELLDPELREQKLGAAEVRQVFPVARGNVAGCLVTEGKVTRNASARVRRGGESLFEGTVGTLKRFKDDATEVRAGLECGIRLDGYDGYQTGDVIEIFEIQKIQPTL